MSLRIQIYCREIFSNLLMIKSWQQLRSANITEGDSIKSKIEKDTTKLVVGIMHVTRDPWLSIVRKGQLPSWEKFNKNDLKVIYFFSVSNKLFSFIDRFIEAMRWRKGRYASYAISYFLMFFLRPWINYLPKPKIASSRESKIDATSLRVNIPELTATMRWKKISFLQYFLYNTNAKFVIISTSSSILNINKIYEYIESINGENTCIYAGSLQQSHDCLFTSGSFTLLSRKAVEILLENRKRMPVHVMDDIAFGSVFKQMGINPVSLDSVNIDSPKKLRNFNDDNLSKYFHFRLKSGDWRGRNDVEIMNELIDRIKNF